MRLFNSDSTYKNHENIISEFWKKHNIHHKMDERNNQKELFRFMDGPPFVNSEKGLHYGHLLISMMKDTVLKYHKMNNKNYLNRMGYDCHGLPIEMKLNEKLGLKTRPEIEEYGVDKYNKECKDYINSCSKSWEPIFERVGRMCDFDNHYKTMDVNFMESEWWVFKQLWNKGLIYNSYKIMPFSTSCETPLSNFEAAENYKEVDVKSIYVLFKLKNEENTYFVAWTTTPWTLTSNIALCVNPRSKYVKIHTSYNKTFIVANKCVDNLDLINITKIEPYMKGINMKGIEYEPIYNFVKRDKYEIIVGDYVDDSSKVGTGIVHISPYHGPEDYQVSLENKIIEYHDIGKFTPVDDRGLFTNQVPDFEGEYVFDTNDKIIRILKENKLLFRIESIKHKYPHCYRTETPLIFKAVSSYFVKATSLKDKMLENNKKVNWYPQSAGKRYNTWVNNIQDWGISRKRFFGTPIPVWISDDGEEQVVIGSIDELVREANLESRPTDLHKDIIDKIQIPSRRNKGMLKNVGDILDCWFDSACVPYGQIHYPFENKNIIDDVDYLADFVCEGGDQVRLWFYVLNVLSTALFNKPAFKNVVCTGIIYDHNGIKFSKKYGNYKDPFELLDNYGADSIRLYLLSSPVINSEPLYFNENNIEQIKKKLIPYINATRMFITQLIDFKNKNNVFMVDKYKNSTNFTDKWIISRLTTSINKIKERMNNYQTDKSINEIFEFINDMTNLYIKFNRDRLRGLINDDEWSTSLSTLYYILINLVKIMTPFTPFLSEHLYSYLKDVEPDNQYESILFSNYPNLNNNNREIESQMDKLKHIVKIVRLLRNRSNQVKTIRIPIKEVIIFNNDNQFLNDVKIIENLAKEEINCDVFRYEKLSDNVSYELEPNNSSLGKKYRSKSKLIRNNLDKIDNNQIIRFANNQLDSLELVMNDEKYILTRDDIDVKIIANNMDKKYIFETVGDLMVAIDTTYDLDSHNNYQLRMALRQIQKLRKDTGLNPWNKIVVHISANNNQVSEYFEDNKNNIENKLKCIIKNNSIPSNNIYANGSFEWKLFNTGVCSILFNIILV